jgi:hypothetical protein
LLAYLRIIWVRKSIRAEIQTKPQYKEQEGFIMPQKTEYVIEGSGKGRWYVKGNPLAIVLAFNSDEALKKYLNKHPEANPSEIEISTVREYANLGTFVESEGEPICTECIELGGGFSDEEEKLTKKKQGPCWLCMQNCRETVKEFIT